MTGLSKAARCMMMDEHERRYILERAQSIAYIIYERETGRTRRDYAIESMAWQIDWLALLDRERTAGLLTALLELHSITGNEAHYEAAKQRAAAAMAALHAAFGSAA